MQNLAEKFYASLGPSVVPGLAETKFDSDLGEVATASRFDFPHERKTRWSVPVPSSLTMVYLLRALELDTSVLVATPHHRSILNRVSPFSFVATRLAGEEITTEMRRDATNFLSKIPAGVQMPEVEFGHGEITFAWRSSDGAHAVNASVEGDGLVGYALKHGDRFFPGNGPEELCHAQLPQDLSEYLEKSFAA